MITQQKKRVLFIGFDFGPRFNFSNESNCAYLVTEVSIGLLRSNDADLMMIHLCPLHHSLDHRLDFVAVVMILIFLHLMLYVYCLTF